jgi:peptidyl-prolyl cis-trans isomerase SurA
LIGVLLLGTSPKIFSQTIDDPVFIRLNGRTVNLSEFEATYQKNNLSMQIEDPKSVEEYLELYINFNLKVLEAINRGMHTNPAFINELKGYREQLAKPYLTDQHVTDQLLEEAYQRMQYDIRASHILVNLNEHAKPADTLAAWNRINRIRERILNGEPFDQVARQESDDLSARDQEGTANRPPMRGNGGDLQYFTVLDMVYPFETAAYNTPVGEISNPIRSSFGYHIIKVTDRLPAMGRAHVAHIMNIFPPGADENAKEALKPRSQDIYERILAGDDFGELAAQYSDDRSSGRRNGEMPPFTSNRMVPEFIKAISQLYSPGSITEPVRTQFGWHIIKLIEKTPPPAFEDVALELKNRISRDSRSQLSQQVVINRLKREFNFRENPSALNDFFSIVDETIFERKWEKSKAAHLNKVLFSFANQSVSQQDFAKYLELSQGLRTPEVIEGYVSAMYQNFVSQKILEFEDSQLESKYPEFKAIMKEYHDGILLFELTDKLVWTKAVEDSTGLRNFLVENQNEYFWPERINATIYTFNNQRIAKQGRREIARAQRRGLDYNHVLAVFNNTSSLNATAVNGVFERDEEEMLNSVPWAKGISQIFPWKGKFAVVHVHELLPSQPKQIEEIRGILIADYQNFLEKKWVEELRQKYKVEVQRNLLRQISE